MADKYGAGQDPYCYPDSCILINKLNIQGDDELTKAEGELSAIAAMEIEFNPPPYNLEYWKNIHHSLFYDIYDWAGKLRTVDISKQDTHFCHTPYIERETNKLFESLAKSNYLTDLSYPEFITQLAEFYCELNMTHPFREGNGRSQRILLEHIVINAGYKITFSGISKEDWMEANVLGVSGDYSKMRAVLGACIS